MSIQFDKWLDDRHGDFLEVVTIGVETARQLEFTLPEGNNSEDILGELEGSLDSMQAKVFTEEFTTTYLIIRISKDEN